MFEYFLTTQYALIQLIIFNFLLYVFSRATKLLGYIVLFIYLIQTVDFINFTTANYPDGIPQLIISTMFLLGLGLIEKESDIV